MHHDHSSHSIIFILGCLVIDYYLLCYSSSEMDWISSENYCTSYISSHLVSFDDDNQLSQFEILRNSISSERNTWIGLYRNNQSSNWKWIDGSNHTQYTKWYVFSSLPLYLMCHPSVFKSCSFLWTFGNCVNNYNVSFTIIVKCTFVGKCKQERI